MEQEKKPSEQDPESAAAILRAKHARRAVHQPFEFQKKLDDLRKALRQYGEHHKWCDLWDPTLRSDYKCTCGFDEAGRI